MQYIYLFTLYLYDFYIKLVNYKSQGIVILLFIVELYKIYYILHTILVFI